VKCGCTGPPGHRSFAANWEQKFILAIRICNLRQSQFTAASNRTQMLMTTVSHTDRNISCGESQPGSIPVVTCHSRSFRIITKNTNNRPWKRRSLRSVQNHYHKLRISLWPEYHSSVQVSYVKRRILSMVDIKLSRVPLESAGMVRKHRLHTFLIEIELLVSRSQWQETYLWDCIHWVQK
jgi:hypothetical protein